MIDVLEHPDTVAKARADFDRRKGEMVYKVMLPPGPAPERIDDIGME
jgi:hypothetical protein